MLIADLFVEGPDREGLGWIGLVGLGAAAHRLGAAVDDEGDGFGDSIALDRYALFFNFVICLTGILTLLMSMDYLHTINLVVGEYYVQLLLAVVGMMLMAAATDLDRPLPRPRAHVDRGLRPGRHLAAGAALERSGAEVLPARRLRLGLPALRHRHGLRRLRHRRRSAPIAAQLGQL